MKNLDLTTIITCLMVTWLCATAHAQVHFTFRVDYDRFMNKHFPGMQMQQFQQMQLTHKYWHFSSLVVSNEYKFTIKMKDSSVLVVKSCVYTDSLKHASYLVIPRRYDLPGAYKDPEKRIYCTQTQEIAIGSNKKHPAIVTDSCWLFKVISGEINAYSFLPGADETVFLRAIQANDGPIQKLTPEALEVLLKDDEEAYYYFKKGKYSDAILVYNFNKRP